MFDTGGDVWFGDVMFSWQANGLRRCNAFEAGRQVFWKQATPNPLGLPPGEESQLLLSASAGGRCSSAGFRAVLLRAERDDSLDFIYFLQQH